MGFIRSHHKSLFMGSNWFLIYRPWNFDGTLFLLIFCMLVTLLIQEFQITCQPRKCRQTVVIYIFFVSNVGIVCNSDWDELFCFCFAKTVGWWNGYWKIYGHCTTHAQSVFYNEWQKLCILQFCNLYFTELLTVPYGANTLWKVNSSLSKFSVFTWRFHRVLWNFWFSAIPKSLFMDLIFYLEVVFTWRFNGVPWK